MDRSVHATEWKPEASSGKHTQAAMPFFSRVPDTQVLSMAIVAQASFNGCLNEAARHSGKDDHEIADEIHISHGYMSKFMRGVAQSWAKRLIAYMRATSSLAPLQWIANQVGCEVVVRDAVTRERDILRARLAELDRHERMAA
jgi:hypothetical protein